MRQFIKITDVLSGNIRILGGNTSPGTSLVPGVLDKTPGTSRVNYAEEKNILNRRLNQGCKRDGI